MSQNGENEFSHIPVLLGEVLEHLVFDPAKPCRLIDGTVGGGGHSAALLERYPKLLIEGCSGGGGRFDMGMLYYVPQIWCSDNTDAPSRLTIQYGSSFAYPVCTMGATCLLVPIKSHGERFPWLPVRSRQCTELSLRTSFFHSA